MTKKSGLWLTMIVAALLLLLLGISAPKAVALAYDGIINVSYAGGEYLYSDANGAIGSRDSLQAVITDIEAHTASPTYKFDKSIVSVEPIVFRKNASMSGELRFNLGDTQAYSVTVDNSATVIFSSLKINTNLNGVQISKGATLDLNGGEISVNNSVYSGNALLVDGTANIHGGLVYFKAGSVPNANIYGYGITVRGTVIIDPSSDVLITGSSGMCVQSGSATVNGGTFSANSTDGGSLTGFGIDLFNGTLEINGGVFNAPIKHSGSRSSVLKIDGGCTADLIIPHTLPAKGVIITDATEHIAYSGSYCDVTVALDGGTATLSAGEPDEDGHRIVGFLNNNQNMTAPYSLSVAEIAGVKPVEDNHYSLSLSCDGVVTKYGTYLYRDRLDPAEIIPQNIPVGYEFDGWVEHDSAFRITADTTLTAKLRLKKPTVSISDLVTTYDGTPHYAEITASHELTDSFTYILKRSNGHGMWDEESSDGRVVNADGQRGFIDCSESSGTKSYRYTVVVDHMGQTAETDVDFNVIINRADYTGITHPDITQDKNGKPFVYDPSKRLANYNAYLTDSRFVWIDSLTFVTRANNDIGYPARYLGDENHNDYSLNIIVRVEKATYTSIIEVPTLGAYNEPLTYEGKTLSEYDDLLEAALKELNPDYNYSWKTYYSWVNGSDKPQVPLNNELFTIYEANFNPEPDTDNYFNSTCKVYAFFKKGNYVGKELPPLSVVYSAAKLADLSPSSDASYRWDYDDEYLNNFDLTVKDGGYDFKCVYNADSRNYNDFRFDLHVEITKAPHPAPAELPEPIAGGAYSGKKLSEFPLPSGYGWLDGDVVPYVGNTEGYDAEYTTDSVNFTPYALKIGIILTKGTYGDIAVPQLNSVVYDPNRALKEIPLPEYYTWANPDTVPTVAVGSYPATYCDSDNYNPKGVTVPLAVSKAPSVIVAKARYEILSGGSVTVTGYADNSEQTAVIPSFTETEVGVYTVYITTAESDNYLAGSFAVTIVICPVERIISEGLTGIISCPDGVPDDLVIAFSEEPADGHRTSIKITVTLNGENYYSDFTVKIKLTDAMNKIKELVFTRDGEAVEYTLEDGYIVFKTVGSGVYLIDEGKKVFPWWWILVGIAAALVICGVFVVLWKKGLIHGKKPASPAPDAQENASAEETAAETEAEPVEGDEEKSSEAPVEETVAENIEEPSQEPIEGNDADTTDETAAEPITEENKEESSTADSEADSDTEPTEVTEKEQESDQE